MSAGRPCRPLGVNPTVFWRPARTLCNMEEEGWEPKCKSARKSLLKRCALLPPTDKSLEQDIAYCTLQSRGPGRGGGKQTGWGQKGGGGGQGQMASRKQETFQPCPCLFLFFLHSEALTLPPFPSPQKTVSIEGTALRLGADVCQVVRCFARLNSAARRRPHRRQKEAADNSRRQYLVGRLRQARVFETLLG